MKLLSRYLALTLALSLAQFPGSASASDGGLADALARFQYALTVEWNQEDESVRDAAVREFLGDLDRLRADGLSDAELAEGLADQALDPESARELRLLSDAVASGKVSRGEWADRAVRYAVDGASLGANWSGSATTFALAAGVVGIVVVILLSRGGSSAGGAAPSSLEHGTAMSVVPKQVTPRRTGGAVVILN